VEYFLYAAMLVVEHATACQQHVVGAGSCKCKQGMLLHALYALCKCSFVVQMHALAIH